MRCCVAAACWKRLKSREVTAVLRVLLGVLVLVLGGSAAQAHPHVWVTVTSEVLYAPDGSVTGVRHAWIFDDMFTAHALQGIEAKTKDAYTREELMPLAGKTLETLKEHDYYTYLKANGGKHTFEAPADYFLDYQDNRLTLHFTLLLNAPVKSKLVLVEILDASYFIDFKMAETAPVKLVDAPAGCQVSLGRQMADCKMAQGQSEDTFKEGGANVSIGRLFDNRIIVDCP
jgi:ABC-type uncharacterized transport system substrate-binding protein